MLYQVHSILCVNWSLFQPNWVQRVVAKTFLVLFQLFPLRKLNFTAQIIRVLQAFRFVWSSTSSSKCSIFLEYSSKFKFVILLSSSNCSNLLGLFSANVLVLLTLVPISFNLFHSWSKFLFIVSLMLVLTFTALAEISWAEKLFWFISHFLHVGHFGVRWEKLAKVSYCISAW